MTCVPDATNLNVHTLSYPSKNNRVLACVRMIRFSEKMATMNVITFEIPSLNLDTGSGRYRY